MTLKILRLGNSSPHWRLARDRWHPKNRGVADYSAWRDMHKLLRAEKRMD
jgi:hypothetical protein